MPNFRNRIEESFESLARIFYRRRILTLTVMLAVVGAFVSQIPKITVDTSTEGFLRKNDPAIVDYNAFRDQFGRDELIIIAIRSPNVFTQPFLKKLRRLHEELDDTVPYVEDITSLVNARNTKGLADELIVGDLLEDWPETEAEMDALRERVFDNPMYVNTLVSETGEFTTIVIKTQTYSSVGIGEEDVLEGFDDGPDKKPADLQYLTDMENTQAIEAVHAAIKKYKAPDFEIHLAGSAVVTHFLKRSMMRDIRKFVLLVMAAIAVFLFVLFRRVSGVILPLAVVVLSVVSTVGIMAAAGEPIKLPTQILPSFLLAVGVGDSVHIISLFYHRLRRKTGREDAVAYAVRHSGLAVLLTSITTAAGLLSFSTAKIAPVAGLGIYSAIGVMLAFVYTLVLLPPLLSFVPEKKADKTIEMEHANTPTDRLLDAVGRLSTGSPKTILLISAAIVVFAIAGITQIRFSHFVLGWFPKDNAIRVATETIDRELRGSITVEAVVDTGRENGFYDPDILNRTEQTAAHVENLKSGEMFAGKVIPITTILKEINRALNENRKDFYTVPQDRQLIAQEFLLFENSGSDDLEDFADSRFSKARFTVKVPFRDAIGYTGFLNRITAHFNRQFPDEKITVTGMVALLSRTITNVIVSLKRSYLIAMAVITVLMIFLIGRVRIGLMSMIPNLFPIVLSLGIMGWFNPVLPMDLFTMLVGSIAIGLAVDDTIHFMHNFRRYFEETGSAEIAVMKTLHTAGRAMLVTTCVLSAGFFIFMFAEMNNIVRFGFLTGVTIITALIADFFIAPALMVVVNRDGPEKRTIDKA